MERKRITLNVWNERAKKFLNISIFIDQIAMIEECPFIEDKDHSYVYIMINNKVDRYLEESNFKELNEYLKVCMER